MGLFGKSFDDKVAEAVDAVRKLNLGVKGFDARVEGKTVTLIGEAPSMEVKARAMREFNALVDTEQTLNTIKLAAPAPAPTPAAGPGGVASAPAAGAGLPGPGASPAARPAEKAPAPRIHVVAKGDTLSAIAKRYYGKANLYPRIFEANRDKLKDPDHIEVGQELRIPELPEANV